MPRGCPGVEKSTRAAPRKMGSPLPLGRWMGGQGGWSAEQGKVTGGEVAKEGRG